LITNRDTITYKKDQLIVSQFGNFYIKYQSD
jgi:hypothetical protein